MAFQQAWAVESGIGHAWGARRSVNTSTGGKTGITRPADLEVRQLATAGDSVRVMPGSATIENTYAGAINESYSVANDAADDDAIVPVPATGSSGPATRYVILRIDDPQYSGQPPADPETAKFCSAQVVNTLAGITYPYMTLARINQPASTATITQAMIEDLRQMAQPRRERYLNTYATVQADSDEITASASPGEYWPNAAQWHLPVPTWATKMHIQAIWGTIDIPGDQSQGNWHVQIGSNGDVDRYYTQTQHWNTPAAGNHMRSTWAISDDKNVQEWMRGRQVQFGVKAWYTDSNTGANRPTVDWGSSIALDVEFVEAPEVTQDATG